MRGSGFGLGLALGGQGYHGARAPSSELWGRGNVMAPWPTQPTTKAAHAAERSRWQREVDGSEVDGSAASTCPRTLRARHGRRVGDTRWRSVGGASYPGTIAKSTYVLTRTVFVRSISPLRAKEHFRQLQCRCAARLSHPARPVSQLIGYLGCWASLDSALHVAVSALPSDLFTGRGGGAVAETEAERLWWRRRWHWFG